MIICDDNKIIDDLLDSDILNASGDDQQMPQSPITAAPPEILPRNHRESNFLLFNDDYTDN